MARHEHPGLQIDTDPPLQRMEWAVQRTAWALLGALLLAVALGLFGRGGPLSTVRLASPDGALRIEHQRFLRFHSPDTLQLDVRAASDTVRVALDGGYVQGLQIERVTPQPEHEVAADGATVFVFRVQPGARVRLSFHVTPQAYGRLRGWIALDGGARLPVAHFIHP